MDQQTLLSDQIACLTEQVAVLAAQVQSNRQQPQVHEYNQQRRELLSCFKCGHVGHIARDCRCQGKDNGMSAQGSGHPTKNVSLGDQVTVAAVRSKIITICGQIGGSM